MVDEVLKEWDDLREAINQSIKHIQNQIQSISSNVSLITTIVALGVSIGLSSIVQKIFIFWIPTSFLLMTLWSLYSGIKSYHIITKVKLEDIEKTYKKYGQKAMSYGYTWYFENSNSISNSVSILFVITLIGLILLKTRFLDNVGNINIVYPVIVSIFYILTLFQSSNWIAFSQKGGFYTNFVDMKSKFNLKTLHRLSQITTAILVLASTAIPLLAFLFIIPTMISLSNAIIYFLVSIILQLFMACIFMSFFSARAARKVLNNSLTSIKIIDDQINQAKLDHDFPNQKIIELKQQYYRTEQYDLRIVDFKVINYYYLSMRKLILEKLINDKI